MAEQGGALLSQLILSLKSLIWGCRNTSCSQEEQWVRGGGTGRWAACQDTW